MIPMAARGGAGGGDREVVGGGVRRLDDRVVGDGRDGLLLGVAEAVAEVGEGGLHRHDDGDDEEDREEEGPGEQVLAGDEALGGVQGEDRRGRQQHDHEPRPHVEFDEQRHEVDGGGQGEGEDRDAAEDDGYAGRLLPGRGGGRCRQMRNLPDAVVERQRTIRKM